MREARENLKSMPQLIVSSVKVESKVGIEMLTFIDIYRLFVQVIVQWMLTFICIYIYNTDVFLGSNF